MCANLLAAPQTNTASVNADINIARIMTSHAQLCQAAYRIIEPEIPIGISGLLAETINSAGDCCSVNFNQE